MTPLIVIGVIIAFLCFVLFLEGNITLEYNNEISVYVTVSGMRFNLFPKKEKKINLAEYSAKRFRKKLEKEKAKAAKKAEKKADKLKKKAKDSDDLQKPKKSVSDIIGDIKTYTSLAVDTLKVFMGHLRIDVCRCSIVVGGKDAATSAMTYGIVSQAVAYLCEILSAVPHFKRVNNTKIEVIPDFLLDGIKADIKVSFRIRLIHILHVAVHGGIGYIKTRTK